MGLGDHLAMEQRQDIKEASWHHLAGALVGQPDTGPTIASQHAQERSSVNPPSEEKTEAQQLK